MINTSRATSASALHRRSADHKPDSVPAGMLAPPDEHQHIYVRSQPKFGKRRAAAPLRHIIPHDITSLLDVVVGGRPRPFDDYTSQLWKIMRDLTAIPSPRRLTSADIDSIIQSMLCGRILRFDKEDQYVEAANWCRQRYCLKCRWNRAANRAAKRADSGVAIGTFLYAAVIHWEQAIPTTKIQTLRSSEHYKLQINRIVKAWNKIEPNRRVTKWLAAHDIKRKPGSRIPQAHLHLSFNLRHKRSVPDFVHFVNNKLNSSVARRLPPNVITHQEVRFQEKGVVCSDAAAAAKKRGLATTAAADQALDAYILRGYDQHELEPGDIVENELDMRDAGIRQRFATSRMGQRPATPAHQLPIGRGPVAVIDMAGKPHFISPCDKQDALDRLTKEAHRILKEETDPNSNHANRMPRQVTMPSIEQATLDNLYRRQARTQQRTLKRSNR